MSKPRQLKPTADWIQIFQEAVLKHAELMTTDPTTANRHFDRSLEAWMAVSREGDKGLDAFRKLLKHESIVVRVRAATYLLPHRTEDALQVLMSGRDAGDSLALVTLVRWSRGFYLDPCTNREVKCGSTAT
jgi:hypothetical protein